ncbi:LysR family transcriptional regulator [Oxalobacteraceae bacterium OTU3REALA1]|nr:LysR family transcriptional regulator [Oxalobacteraceae bacterium OTU3REALA1]
MRANDFAELSSFVAVAEARSFRKAAAALNLTPSTLSHSLRALEQRLGVRLLNRTTRSVSVTEAGQALLDQVAPALSRITSAIEDVNSFRDRPQGTVRINSSLLGAKMALAPRLGSFAAAYPDVTLEVAINDGFVDIAREGYDAGIRLGESVEQDMSAVRVTPDLRLAIVASPAYLARHAAPLTPHQLTGHNCIGYREIAGGNLCRWEFEKDGRPLTVQVSGSMILGTPELMVDAALAGVGLASAIDTTVTEHLAAGRLVRVLEDWCAPFPGFHLYFSSRRQTPGALRALIDFIRLPGRNPPQA